MHTYASPMCKKTAPVEVLNGLDLDVSRGSVLGLLGHNGAGKSTTIRILSGEERLQAGQLSYNLHDGKVDLQPNGSSEAIRGKIGVCPQHNNLLGDETCRETLQLFAGLRGDIPMEPGQSLDEAIDAEAQRLIDQIAFTSSEDSDKPVKTYSGGMKRKVCIALSLLGNPEIVFLDEPTAGVDPYNRRGIWDMIIEAKKDRSIILCSHHLEEVDLLSDRVAILKKGRIVTSGTTLFLKHHFGVGYSLRFDSRHDLDVTRIIEDATRATSERPGTFKWSLSHGTEPSFPSMLSWLESEGARNIEVELTTLEQVFLATGKEEESSDTSDDGDDDNDNERLELDLEEAGERQSFLSKVWANNQVKHRLSFWDKFFIVAKFAMQDAWKQPEAIVLNVTLPLLYMVGGLVAVYLVGESDAIERVEPDPIPISSQLLSGKTSEFFGLDMNTTDLNMDDIVLTDAPTSFAGYHDAMPVLGGYLADTNTLEYNNDITGFATQIGTNLMMLANFGRLGNNDTSLGINLQQVPYDSEEDFRLDSLLIPIALVYGFTGMVFSMIDILTYKANNIISLFRVGGVNEWTVCLGVTFYKCITSFLPFFVILIVLGLSFETVIFGNAGRWLATVILLLLYAYSATPMGLIISKKLITKDFDDAKGWFPSIYFAGISVPYTAWNLAYQLVDGGEDTLLIVGDFLNIIPPVAFQRGLGAIVDVSTKFDDDDLTYSDVFEFESRVIVVIICMFVIGTAEWIYLYRLTTTKPEITKLAEEDKANAVPVPIHDEDVLAEKQRSLDSGDGIYSRGIVKVFEVDLSEEGEVEDDEDDHVIKRAIKGVSFGIKRNEIYVLLGPNGAGKTTLMSVLAGTYTPENGSASIDGRGFSAEDRGVDHIFERSNISWCPQYDSLFQGLTVEQHLEFYARIRGLDWDSDVTQEHIEAVARLLGLTKHMEKYSTDLSGGYKRRLSLGIAMVGYPTAMLVDECTTGLDPGARHLVWSALKPDLVNEEYKLPAILFSTHYMDEAEELATRIGIMIDGELVATGDLDRLQQRFCKSYFVEIALDRDAPEQSQNSVVRLLRSLGMDATVYESLPYNFKLKVPFLEDGSGGIATSQSIKQLATIFDVLEKNKRRHHIKFYSVAQMSLEQIFIDLSKKQFRADESVRHTGTSQRRTIAFAA